MLGVNGGHLPRFNFIYNVVNGRSIQLIHMMIRSSDSPRKDSIMVISSSRLLESNARFISIVHAPNII